MNTNKIKVLAVALVMGSVSSFGLVNVTSAAQITNRSVALSNSAPSATGVTYTLG